MCCSATDCSCFTCGTHGWSASPSELHPLLSLPLRLRLSPEAEPPRWVAPPPALAPESVLGGLWKGMPRASGVSAWELKHWPWRVLLWLWYSPWLSLREDTERGGEVGPLSAPEAEADPVADPRSPQPPPLQMSELGCGGSRRWTLPARGVKPQGRSLLRRRQLAAAVHPWRPQKHTVREVQIVQSDVPLVRRHQSWRVAREGRAGVDGKGRASWAGAHLRSVARVLLQHCAALALGCAWQWRPCHCVIHSGGDPRESILLQRSHSVRLRQPGLFSPFFTEALWVFALLRRLRHCSRY